MPFLKYTLPAVLLAGCVNTTGNTQAATADKPGAYMIVMGKDYVAADLGSYQATLPPIYEKYGGRYVALSTDLDFAEGRDDLQAVIISAWPDAAAARRFWDSPEYRESVKLREGIGVWDVVIVPALP